MHTIILEDFGIFLGKKSDRFVVKKKGKMIAEFPVSHVERVIVSSSGASMSSAALHLAVQNRVPVCFTYSSGAPFAFLTPTMGHGTVLTRRAQYEQANTEVATELAKGFVLGKLLNQRCLLKSWAKTRTRTKPEISERLFNLVERIDTVVEEIEIVSGPMTDSTRQSLMNIEARGASEYWSGVSAIVPQGLGFVKRTTRGASDVFNMLLNYGYGILYSEVWSAVNTAGLDPFAGFLHVDRPGRPSLVLDLIEEFRQQSVDRVIVTLLNRRAIDGNDAIGEDGLSKATRQALAVAVVERLQEHVSFAEKKVPLKNVIVRQAWAVTRLLRGDSPKYLPFVMKW